MRDDQEYLKHIAENLDIVGEYLNNVDGSPDEDLFYRDRRTRDAVIRRLETLADAAGHLSDALKVRHPSVPWGRINGFRNRLAHGYLGVDLSLVWEVVSVYLPSLRPVIEQELRPSPKE